MGDSIKVTLIYQSFFKEFQILSFSESNFIPVTTLIENFGIDR